MTTSERGFLNLDGIVGRWQQCTSCKIVDTDRGRSTVGHPCQTCNKPSNGGDMYFDSSVHLVVDLIEEAASSEHTIKYPDTAMEYSENTHFVSVLLFFCTLREILLNNLIRQLCLDQSISNEIYDRLRMDNRLYTQKQDRLFPSLTKVKWTAAIATLDNKSDFDFQKLNADLKRFSDLRNKFAHEGHGFEIDKSTCEECVLSIEPLIHLYVDLHNAFVHKQGSAC